VAKKRKKSKDLFPKKIAGVKVPKTVRKGRFGELLASPKGQALIAQAVVGAGAIAAGLKAKDSPKVRQVAHDVKHAVTDKGADAADTTGEMTTSLAYAIGEAARSFADALHRHGSAKPRSYAAAAGDDGETAWTPPPYSPVENKGAAKKQSAAREADTH
jgi:hypothetical protein